MLAWSETFYHMCLSLGVCTLLALGTCSGSWTEDTLRLDAPELRIAGTVPWPERSNRNMSGSDFLRKLADLDKKEREDAIVQEVLRGNVPEYSRYMVPLRFKIRRAYGRWHRAVIWVSANYLAVGANDDYLFVPLNFYSATKIARKGGFLLPTRKIVNAIYNQAEVILSPQPLPAGPDMELPSYYGRHNDMVLPGLEGLRPGALAAGYKKDVVFSNILNRRGGRLAIYGWHRARGQPIQPLSTAHHAGYADYSHGIRFVHAVMLLNGRRILVRDLLQHPRYANLLSDEGPLKKLGLMQAGSDPKLNTAH